MFPGLGHKVVEYFLIHHNPFQDRKRRMRELAASGTLALDAFWKCLSSKGIELHLCKKETIARSPQAPG
jgi:hypothetical protein